MPLCRQSKSLMQTYSSNEVKKKEKKGGEKRGGGVLGPENTGSRGALPRMLGCLLLQGLWESR